MVTIKVLKRKDAASVIVAVVLGLILSSTVGSLTSELARVFSGLETSGAEWQAVYLFPVVSLLIQVVILEVALRVIIGLRAGYMKSR